MRKDLQYVDTTEVSLQLKHMTLTQLSYCVEKLTKLFGDTSEVSLNADWDGVAWMRLSFPMSQDEWEHSGLVNQLYVLEKECIAYKTIRHFEKVVRKRESVKK